MAGIAESISQKLGLRASTSSEKAMFQGMSQEDVEELTRLRTLREIPKAKFLAAVALKVYQVGQKKRTVYSHVDVYRSVENVATKMREVGVRPGSVCAFALPNTIETIVYFLAVQWVNAIAFPIDPNLDEVSIAGILERSSAKTFVSMDVDEDERETNAMYQKFSQVARTVGVIHWHCYSTRNQGVVLDTHDIRAGDTAAWHGGSGDYGVDPETNAVYLASDAKEPPLLLPLTHKAIASAAKIFTSTYHLNQKKCTVFTNPVHSVHGLLLLVSTFYSGGSLILVPDGAFNLADTWDYIENDDMTYLCLSAEQVLSLAETAAIKAPAGSAKLDFIRVCPGSVDSSSISIEELERTLRTFVLESYGTPESSGVATTATEFEKKEGTLGKAVTGCEVAIFDPTTREKLGPNIKGDVAVRGVTVPTEGYLDDAEFNSWANIPDADGVPWFCTGDRGQIDEDGYLTVFGNSWAARKKEVDANALAAPAAMESRALPVQATAVDADEEGARRELEAALKDRAQKEVKAAEERAEEFERNLPAKEYESMRTELDQYDPTTSSLITSALANDDVEYLAMINGDAVRKQELELEAIKDRARRLTHERDLEGMQQTRQETNVRAERMTRERQSAEAADREFRLKLDRVMALSAQQKRRDEQDQGPIFMKLNEIAEHQTALESRFEAQHRQAMDSLVTRINDLNREIGQLSEQNFRAKSAALANQSAPMMIELKMDEADAAAIAAAAAAEEAMQHSELAKERALAICRMAEEATKMGEEATVRAGEAAVLCETASNVAKDAGLLIPPSKQTVVHEVLAAAPENLDSVERRLEVDMTEVDRVMASHPSVNQAVAFPMPNAKAGFEIAVAITTRPGAKVTDAWLKLHAQSLLPPLAVPSKWYWMRELPDGMTRDEVAVSDDLIDFEKLKNRPMPKIENATVQPPPFVEAEPAM